MVQSVAEAEQAVAATRYPPRGVRGVSGATRANKFGKVGDYFTRIEDETTVIVQLETRAALAQAEDIASVDGVTGVFFGPADIAAAVKEDDSHHPITRLLSLENTHNGKAVSLARLDECIAPARAAGLSVHLDGARVFNAATALGCELTEIAGRFDTVSICLSKGLGAPVGSVLVGPADLIDRARRWRKMVGGGMRQAGVLAAAGLHALDRNVARLAEDHARAEALASALRDLGAGSVEQDTNMVFFTPATGENAALGMALAKQGVVISAGGTGAIRMVLHKDVTDDGFAATLAGLKAHLS